MWAALAMATHWPGNSAGSAEPPNVLDVPALLELQNAENAKAVALLKAGQYGRARVILRQSVLRIPHDVVAVYNLACAYALMDEKPEAIDMLKAALKLGLRAKAQLQADEDLKSLHGMPEFAEILKACDEPPPKQAIGWNYTVAVAPLQHTGITVDSDNMFWNTQARVMQVFLSTKGAGDGRLASGALAPWADQVMTWFAEGTAAGNLGDLYDNHDRGHSALSLSKFPQLTPLRFGPEVQKRQLDNGPQRMFVYYDARPLEPQAAETSAKVPPQQLALQRTLVLGNSSTAMTGNAFWRSMPRLLQTTSGGIELLAQQYTNNHLYVYPEHRDHDAGHDEANGWGDVFAANTPFYLVSQGSSGSDQPILEALAATVSAFPKETKQLLKERGLVAPTLQMIFRRCQQSVQSDEDYLQGSAHPTVFEGGQADVQRMVEMAHGMKADELPPAAMLRILKEETFDPSVDYFDATGSELLFTSPFALARVCNATRYWREMIVSSAGSVDINHRPLTYHWVVLRGDPQRVIIEPIEGDPDARRLRVAYHPRRPVQPGSSLESCRVDIGLFAHNGLYYSAPALLSFYFPDNEIREYDDQQRIAWVDYRAASKNYVDPALIADRQWRDEYRYDDAGTLTGWTRIRGSQREEFNALGQLMVPTADGNRIATDVVYQRLNYPDGRPFIKQKLSEAN